MFDTRTLSGVGVLAAIAEAGNFARAGEILGLTPSGVSRAVARLEARVGVRLFDRSARFVTLTEEGRRFHAQVMPLLDSLEDAATELVGSASEARGRLRVSIDPWFARIVVAPALPAFMANHPELSIEFTISNHREEMMVGTDVAVRFGPPDDSALVVRKLAETAVMTCASPGYLRDYGTPEYPEDLLNHETILFRNPQTGRPFAWGYERDGQSFEVDVRGRLVVDDPSMAVELCAAGQGIFQSFSMGLEPWLDSQRLVPILSRWSNELYPLYAYHPSRHLPPAKVRVFLEFVQAITRRSARNDQHA